MFSTVIYNVFRFCFYVFQISFNCLRTQNDLSGWVKRTLRSNVCALTNNLARTTVIDTTGLAPTVYKVKYGVGCWRQCHPCNVRVSHVVDFTSMSRKRRRNARKCHSIFGQS